MQWPPPPLAKALVVDGVQYRVPEWMEVGTSIFLPCLNHKGMFSAVRRHYAIRSFKFTYTEDVDKNILGIRVWRVL